ncbi:RidA family protein [Phreatobacter sp. AB_2022a]|uniref:RidA family protein n=1 Tax=Phreatobacter sp. AB_2022a TaxID=3003134 RepID=UPI0022874697|nr:RidA family protein [Phreatobacter sp. AB_2022a]MCZ0738053.1 RidA family protein [Phreatobacter sp. AB_2022a]
MTEARHVRVAKKWPSERWQETWVPAVKADNVLYVSGITATDIDGRPIGSGDFAAQAERCLDKLSDVLGRVGGSLQDVVKLTTYLSPNAGPDAAAQYFAVRERYFGRDGPASTGVVVAALIRPEYLLEIEAIAHLPK